MKHSLLAEMSPFLEAFESPLILFLSQHNPLSASDVKALHSSSSIHFSQQSSKNKLSCF